MTAYMKDQFPFLGISTKPREVLLRDALVGLSKPSEPDLIDVTRALWGLDEREHQYAALGILRRNQRVLTRAFLPTARFAITTRSWWDTVDTLATETS